MTTRPLTLEQEDLRRLLAAASPDAALLYLYLKCGNPPQEAPASLNMAPQRVGCAEATLRQLGLIGQEKPAPLPPAEGPGYSERDVLEAMDGDVDFRNLYGEVQRLLGRSLNTEELKILLGFVRYLGFSADVISILICYCKERSCRKGSARNPSLRTIEKEAYAWAQRGIDTVEEAAAFIQAQNLRESRLHRVMDIVQIHGRRLTAAEERYAQGWLDMGLSEELIALAYERTCLNTGGLNWAYMNKILQRWHSQGLRTAQDVRSGDRAPAKKAGSFTAGQRELDSDEIQAIQQLMREG